MSTNLQATSSERDKFQSHAVDEMAAGRMGLLETVRESYRISHGRLPAMDNDSLAHWALHGGSDSLMAADAPHGTPGDFPNILSNLSNKILDGPLDYSPATYTEWAFALPPLKNFKPATIIRAGEFREFPEHIDGDEFDDSTFQTELGWIEVASYGDEFGLTPKMIVDDDLGAFMQSLQDKKTGHDLTLNRLCVNLLVKNAEAGDGYDLFDDANHGNEIDPGAPPDTDQLSAMRLKLRKQTGVSAVRQLGLPLGRLLIPSDLETDVEKLLRVDLNVVPTTTAGAEPFRGEVDWVVESMLDADSATKYYGFAPPASGRAILFAHQIGYEKMQIRRYFNPQNNCLVHQCEGRFAAVVGNYRGVVRNIGTPPE